MSAEEISKKRKLSNKNLSSFSDGYTGEQIFVEKLNCNAYTFDDVIIMPGHMSSDPTEVCLKTRVSRHVELMLPLLSSPMDTVTEHEMAIAMALQGALGVVHYNMTIEEQVNEVRLVKKFKNGFITDPACLSPEHCISDVDRLKAQFGYSGIPITHDGRLGSALVGIVTNRDVDYIADRTTKLRDVMTSGEHLITAPEGVSLAEANELLRRAKKGKLPVVNKLGEIVALISRTGTSTVVNYLNAH